MHMRWDFKCSMCSKCSSKKDHPMCANWETWWQSVLWWRGQPNWRGPNSLPLWYYILTLCTGSRGWLCKISKRYTRKMISPKLCANPCFDYLHSSIKPILTSKKQSKKWVGQRTETHTHSQIGTNIIGQNISTRNIISFSIWLDTFMISHITW